MLMQTGRSLALRGLRCRTCRNLCAAARAPIMLAYHNECTSGVGKYGNESWFVSTWHGRVHNEDVTSGGTSQGKDLEMPSELQ